MLKERIISAGFMLAAFLVFNFAVNDFLFALVLAVMAGLAAWEWSRLAGFLTGRQMNVAGVLALTLVLTLLLLLRDANVARWLSLSALLFWLAVPMVLYLQPSRSDTTEKSDFLALLVGFYLLFCCAYFLHQSHYTAAGGSPWLCLYVLSIAWIMDIGAYFAGKRWGKTKLAPLISPGKTREGALGGLALTILFLLICLMLFPFARANAMAFIFGTLLAACVSIIGDLYESRLKRAAGLKDSSQLIPGHGGILDRIDGQLAAVPVFYFAWVWL